MGGSASPFADGNFLNSGYCLSRCKDSKNVGYFLDFLYINKFILMDLINAKYNIVTMQLLPVCVFQSKVWTAKLHM